MPAAPYVRRSIRLVAPALLVLALSCARDRSDGGVPATAPSSSVRASVSTGAAAASASAKPVVPPFRAELEGQPFELKGAKVVATSTALHLVLSTGQLACDSEPKDGDETIELDLSPGPGAKFSVGQAQGVPARWTAPKRKLKRSFAGAHEAALTLEPFELVEGAAVAGSLAFDVGYSAARDDKTPRLVYRGAGRFSAPLCKDWNGFKALGGVPADAGASPFAGTFGGDSFTYQRALAIVMKDAQSDEDYLDSIELYDDPQVDCKTRFDKKKTAKVVVFSSIGGGGAKHPLTGPQSADASFSVPAGGGARVRAFASRRAWVSFDALAFKGGDALTGTLFAESSSTAKPADAAKMAGTVKATVCSLSW